MKNLIYLIGIFAVIALGSCNNQETEETKLLKIKIEMLSAKIATMDSLHKELELCDMGDLETTWKILQKLNYTPEYDARDHSR